MIRLKQLLGISLLAIAATSLAAGSVSQLAGVQVENRDNASIITVRANGTFTHTEYRPTESLMLVDLAGVSVAQQDANVHSVSAAGVQSYRVASYRSASGAEVARLELNLAPGATVKVADIEGGVELRVTGVAHTASASAAAPISDSALSRISNIAVARGKDGLNIEITGSGPMTAKTMKLNHPDRVVLDIPNSVLEGRPREISVNSSDVKDVRAARFQSTATRIVVDMATLHEFEVVPAANKLVLMLKTPSAAPLPSSPAKEPVKEKEVVAQQTAPAAQPDAKTAEPVVAALSAPAPAKVETKPEGRTRADLAASHFVSGDGAQLMPANASMAMTPALVNAALMQQATTPAQPQAQPQSSSASGASASTEMATGCTTGRYTGTPFNLNLKDLDLKDFFRLISDISGLNVVLDPSVKGSLTIVLNDVPWDQALAIVLNNNGLECQLQGNVLRIATIETLRTEAEARRAQQEAQSLAVPKQTFTRYLSYAHSKDLVAVIKRFLSPRGDVVSDDRSNALIIEDIPGTLPKVDALLTALDRKTPEVEIEARIVAATRSFARDIGTQLGFGWGNSVTATGGGSGANSPITVTQPPGVTPSFITAPGNSSVIPLFSNLAASGPTSGFSLVNSSSIYRLDFVLTMAESRGLLKILSRPRVVTQNNITALVKQGSRIPVVTQAQLGGPPTVTYVDAFLRLTVTPQITAEKTIFLNVDIENTVPDFSRVTGSQLNPTLQTQQTTTQVLVNNGQTITIGGVIQVNNNVAVAQVPLLGSIPILGNLFKHTTVNTNNQELIFFITPKIIQT